MSITASRLGSAPLTLDWSNLTRVSHAVNDGAQEISAAWNKLKARFHEKDVGFYNAPIQNELSQAEESVALAAQLLQKRDFTDCLILGIGGSALGPISLLTALKERCTTGIRFHFMENPDPTDWKGTISGLRPETTLVCAITKSGTTFETMAVLLLAIEWLGKARMKTHLVAITDPEKGDLKAFATQEGIPTLHIAPSIGGRFSIFSPVGLFPAALAGLSVTDFLQGAKQVRDYCEKHALEKNPLMILGRDFIRNYPKRPIHVCMPYSTRLKLISAWFVQLWGESLGKNGKGFTPLAAVGAVDQHSILQLLRDGPDDKITMFLTVDQVADEVKIPHLQSSSSPLGSHRFPAFRLLEGHTLHELLRTEYQATSLVLSKQGKPNLTLNLDKLDERCMGALYFSLSVLTGFTGTLWDVNPFDQPGVEEGKVYIREALSAPRATPEEMDENSPVARLRREQT
jgi:glucose-6-phosphate isomerase